MLLPQFLLQRLMGHSLRLANAVKLVIWDLDDTFWQGTLSEGDINFIEKNILLIIELAHRGILSSVVSKNNRSAAESKLRECGAWEYIVFPRIEFTPKGPQIAALIEQIGLRAENVLFIDDNPVNLREAQHYSPGLMVATPHSILPDILDHSELSGKDDPELTRLKQYKTLEGKVSDRNTWDKSNEDFLRQCKIHVSIDFDIDAHIDRVIELANRSNQLNYTKKRLETQTAVDEFKTLLQSYGHTAGVISASDCYGDYGLVGFFVQRRVANANLLIHFVFSCRAMNMGIEQYVYERLGRPEIKISQPVSNPIVMFESVDWIQEGNLPEHSRSDQSAHHLLLIGACDLLQMSAMCGDRRAEFVNIVRGGRGVRFDDPYFIMCDRRVIRADQNLNRVKFWTANDAELFDEALESSEIVISSLFAATGWSYFESNRGVRMRLAMRNLERILKEDGLWFVQHFRHIPMNFQQRFELIGEALDHMASRAPGTACHFTLGANTKAFGATSKPKNTNAVMNSKQNKPVLVRGAYNAFMRQFCAERANFHYIDIDERIESDDVVLRREGEKYYADHLHRRTYISIADNIRATVRGQSSPSSIT